MKLRPAHIALVFASAALIAGACAHMPDKDLYSRRKAVAAVNHIADLPLDWLWRMQYWTANQYNIKLAQALEPDYHWVTRLEVDVHVLGPAALSKMAKKAGATPEAVGLYHCPDGRCCIAVLGGRRKGQGIDGPPQVMAEWTAGHELANACKVHLGYHEKDFHGKAPRWQGR